MNDAAELVAIDVYTQAEKSGQPITMAMVKRRLEQRATAVAPAGVRVWVPRGGGSPTCTLNPQHAQRLIHNIVQAIESLDE